MKVRIHNNSIRLRLSRPEVAAFQKGGHVEERLEFGPELLKSFRCVLIQEEAAQAVTARYLPGLIEVVVPQALAQRWAESEDVRMNGSYSRGEKPISIAIEKDFQCLHRDEKDGDAFPNPAAVAER